MKKSLIFLAVFLGLINCQNISYKNKLHKINFNADDKNEAVYLNKKIGFKQKYSLWLYTEKPIKQFSKKQKLMVLENYNPATDFLEVSFRDYNKDSLTDILIRTKFKGESLRKFLISNQSNPDKTGHLKFRRPIELSVLPEFIYHQNANKINLQGF